MAAACGLPQERVQNRATYTGKVFTVRHKARTPDNVGFIKGVDKHNMPRLGRCDGVCAPDHQGYRRPCGESGFLVRSEINGCCGRAFVSLPTKAPGP